jgi:hypothetical protein
MPWQVSGRSVFRISLAGVIMAGCLILAKNLLSISLFNLFFLIALGVIVYTGILLLIKEMTHGEIKLIKSYSAKLVRSITF